MYEAKTPWKVIHEEKWPFDFSVIDAEGTEVMTERAVCHTSIQKTAKDNEDAVGFNWVDKQSTDRETAQRLIREQREGLEHIVRCVNAHDALVKALMQYRTNYAMHDSEVAQKGFEPWVEIQATADKALLLAGIEVPK